MCDIVYVASLFTCVTSTCQLNHILLVEAVCIGLMCEHICQQVTVMIAFYEILLLDRLFVVLDKHAPPSLRKVITHSSSPWFESMRDERFIAK